jgi:hypothetical protein
MQQMELKSITHKRDIFADRLKQQSKTKKIEFSKLTVEQWNNG